MCEPTTIAAAGLALSAASTAASLENQRRQASITATNARLAQQRAAMDEARQSQQIARQGQQQANELARQQTAKMALFDVAVGEFGGGHSLDRAAAVATLGNQEALATLQANETGAQAETAFAGATRAFNTEQRLASINGPDYAGALLTLGSQAAQTYIRANPAEKPQKP